MHAPIRPIEGRWPRLVQRRLGRFFWCDPAVMLDEQPTADAFRRVMSALHVGNTIKITGIDRHPEADALLVENVQVENAAILDIGASDGSTSVDLIKKLPGFRSYTITDLFFYLQAARVGSHVVFHDQDGKAILVAGRRMVAWPSLSRLVRAIYWPVIRRASRPGTIQARVLLLNPEARLVISTDPRVDFRAHDVFTPWDGPTPDIIKVANLLRRLYFDDDQIRRGLRALLSSLDEGGHLLLVDNPRIPGIDERACLYRRQGGRFALIGQTPHPAEIDDLVRLVTIS